MDSARYKFELTSDKRKFFYQGVIKGEKKTSTDSVDHNYTEYSIACLACQNSPFNDQLKAMKSTSLGDITKKIRLFANRERLIFKRLQQ